MNRLKLIVRVRHNNYMHKNKLVSEVSATLLSRKSNGTLSDLICDPDLDISQLNLGSYEDGLYRIITENHSFDIESGILDDYELVLTPYSDNELLNKD